jgi:hypothetical protein
MEVKKKLTKKQFDGLILKAYKSSPSPKSVELVKEWIEKHSNYDMFTHWNNTWVKNFQLLSNKKILDIGISAGIHNYIAQEVFNTKTIVAVDPHKPYHNIVKSLLPDCKLYNVVDEVPNGVKVDTVLLLGVLVLLGKNWKKFLKQVVDKFKFDHMIIRDGYDFYVQPVKANEPREYSLVSNFTYVDRPTVKEILKELQSNQLDVVKQYQLTSHSLKPWVFVVDNKQRSL